MNALTGAIDTLTTAVSASPAVARLQQQADEIAGTIDRIRRELDLDPRLATARAALESLRREQDDLERERERHPEAERLRLELDRIDAERDDVESRSRTSIDLRKRELAVRDAEERLREIEARLDYNAREGRRDGRSVNVISDENFALQAERERLLRELPGIRERAEVARAEESKQQYSAERRAIELERLAIARADAEERLEQIEAQYDARLKELEKRAKAEQERVEAITRAGDERVAALEKQEAELRRKIEGIADTGAGELQRVVEDTERAVSTMERRATDSAERVLRTVEAVQQVAARAFSLGVTPAAGSPDAAPDVAGAASDGGEADAEPELTDQALKIRISKQLAAILAAGDDGGVSILFRRNEKGELMPEQEGGAVSFQYARQLIDQYRRDYEKRYGDERIPARDRYALQEAMQKQEEYFRRLFPQLGNLRTLMKQLAEYERVMKEREERERRSTKTTTSGTVSKGSASTSQQTTSASVLTWSGALR